MSDEYFEKPSSTLSELEKLISLAENVSGHLKELEELSMSNKQRQYIILGCIYAFVMFSALLLFSNMTLEISSIYRTIISASSLIMSLPLIVALFNARRRARKLSEDLEIESSVLAELLDLIHELENYSRFAESLDPVAIATYRMRLKRLRFSIK
ncbi:hypothetical protein [Vibrio ouci]|uniref:SLATT domain-containing protein n=1 Tax=Vibrio ouci TaxID=2499078 RepID=A0A4Y8W8F5_9VIBR|nr:hypothetical protein [Vibrio ouci]TFH89199.1 hypothetical protein ELS82_23555 [Vibrio ouci]